MTIPSAWRSATVADNSLQLVEMLTAMLAAGGIDGTLRVERSHPVQGLFGDAGVGFLRRSCWSPCAGARSSPSDNV